MRSLYLILLMCPLGALAVTNLKVDHAYVVSRARQLVTKPYNPDAGRVGKALRELDYDQYRRILYRPDKSLWLEDNRPFRVQFFHPGFIHDRKVELHEFVSGYTQRIPFNRERFNYQELKFPFWTNWGLDYAGFRLLNEMNEPGKWDEVISFLGASYFRALARGQAYGISARGIAVNTGEAEPEEFPRFTTFWLGKPAADAAAVTIHALLEGASVTGAYTFTVRPGDETIVDVQATLFLRREVKSLGLAPMTSMFWFGELSEHRFGDFRPEVHDSDGLLVAADDGARLWRPLVNPAAKLVTAYAAPRLAGFGLLQRDRDFHHYEDLEASYERRPGLWVEPLGEWPAGTVRLMELPTDTEHHDNIVAWWAPEKLPAPGGDPLEISWRLRWTNAPAFAGPPGWVQAARRTVRDGAPDRTHYVVDFAFPEPVDPQQVPEIELTAPAQVQVLEKQVIFNRVTQSWRLSLRLAAAPGGPVADIRARLLRDGRPVTETISLSWQPSS